LKKEHKKGPKMKKKEKKKKKKKKKKKNNPLPSLSSPFPLFPLYTYLFIGSDKANTGYKGVYSHNGRCKATCNTSPCHHNHLGRFDTPEDAAQSYLQHYETEHPEELEKERAPPPVEKERAPPPVLPEVQVRLLIRSDKAKTGYKGVIVIDGRYQAKCTTSPCRHNHLGMFGTPEYAAQSYLQHHQEKHLEVYDEDEEASPPPPSKKPRLSVPAVSGGASKGKHPVASGEKQLMSGGGGGPVLIPAALLAPGSLAHVFKDKGPAALRAPGPLAPGSGGSAIALPLRTAGLHPVPTLSPPAKKPRFECANDNDPAGASGDVCAHSVSDTHQRSGA
jgi:hypothetical protein